MALTIRAAVNDADLQAINTLFTAKVSVANSGVTVTYGAKTLTDTAGGFLSLPATIVGMTVTVGAKTGTIASRTATVVTLTANWTGGAPVAGSAYAISPGFSIVDELTADFGSMAPMTLAFWQPILADPKARVVMGFQPANTLRGAAYWRNERLGWVCYLVAIDKSLTDAQRLSGFHDFVIEGASRVPPATRFSGVLKKGGKLHTYLQPRLAASSIIDQGNFVLIDTTAGELVAVA